MCTYFVVFGLYTHRYASILNILSAVPCFVGFVSFSTGCGILYIIL